MAGREIIPFGFDLNKKLDALALSIIPLKEIAPIHQSQSYFAQAIHRPVIAPPPPRLFLEDKPCQQKPSLDVPKLIKVMKEINLLPPKGNEVLTGVKTNKFGDVTCVKYKSVTPCITIDGVWAMSKQIKVVPPKEKRRAPSTILENEEKRPWMTMVLLQKKIEDFTDFVHTFEQRIDEEHIHRKSLQHDVNILNHYVTKPSK